MLLTCSQRDLLAALQTVSKAVNVNNTLPVLNNILLKAEGKRLTFAATNLEIAITTSIKAEIRNEGSITVPARLFTSYVGLLNAGDVELANREGLDLVVKAAKSQTKIKGISSDEFPLIPQVKRELSIQLVAKEFVAGINQVGFAAARDMVRPVLAGMLFSADKKGVRLAATDSYRLSEKMLQPVKLPENPVSLIIPTRTVSELARVLEKDDELVTVDIAGSQALFLYKDIELATRLIEGAFPDYSPIIPKSHATQIEVKHDELATAVKRVSLFAKDSHTVRVAVTADKRLEVYSDATQIGEERAEVAAQITGTENLVALNANYLLEALAAADSKDITIEMGDRTAPVVVKPSGGKDFLHLIMPLKV